MAGPWPWECGVGWLAVVSTGPSTWFGIAAVKSPQRSSPPPEASDAVELETGMGLEQPRPEQGERTGARGDGCGSFG